MKGEQAYPARGVDGVCVRMMTLFRNLCRNVMNRNDPVEDHCDHKAEKTQGKVIEERVAYHFCSTPYSTEATNGKENQVPDRSSRLWLSVGAINEGRPCFTRADYSSVADIHQLFDGPQWVQDLSP